MTRIEEMLAVGASPFGNLPEVDIWPMAPALVAGERSREFVAAIDRAFPDLEHPAEATAMLFGALGSDDALTATGAASALVRHHAALGGDDRDRLSDTLAAQSRAGGDGYRSSQIFALLVVLARLNGRYRHLAADTALRLPTTLEPNAVAERVVAAIGLLEAAGPDETLFAQLTRWTEHPDELVQAESEYQLGRAHVRTACRDAGTRNAQLDAAGAAFRRASSVEDRTDAALWLGIIDLLAAFRPGVPSVAEIEPAADHVRTLARERIWSHGGRGPTWAIEEDRLLLRIGEQLRDAAVALEGVGGHPNLGEPLASLARAAAEVTALAELGIDTALIGMALQSTVQHAVAMSLDIEIDQALTKVERLLNLPDLDASERRYLAALRTELEGIPKHPKGEGAAADAAPPGPLDAGTSAFLATSRRGLATATGSPLGDRILDELWAEIGPTVAEDADRLAIELVRAGLELLVGFVVRRTIDPTALQTERPPYLFAKSHGGLGADAIEEDVRRDLLRFIVASDYYYLLDKERAHMGGRTDLCLVIPPAPPLTIETKRERSDASLAAIRANHVAQTQTYVAFGPRVGFLLVLDLTPMDATVEPNVRSRFWIDHIDPRVGSGDRPNYVVVALLSGNRVPPSARHAGPTEGDRAEP